MNNKDIYKLKLKILVFKMLSIIPDDIFLKILFRVKDHKKLNLKKPMTFNEKLQWLKLYDHNPAYIKMVDKYASKEIVSKKAGEQYIVPSLGKWERFGDIDFEKLPDKFVLKTNHDNAGVVIVKDKSKLDKKAAKIFLSLHLNDDYYLHGREWPYKYVERCIFAEELLEDLNDSVKDYKVFCFAGKPMYIMTVEGGHEDETRIIRRIYNPKWEKVNVGLHGKNNEKTVENKPEQLEEMLRVAGKLSEGFKHIRVDFYIVKGRLYVGELTLYHMSGHEKFRPQSFDRHLGDLIKL